jgi:hypothetical protein
MGIIMGIVRGTSLADHCTSLHVIDAAPRHGTAWYEDRDLVS